MTMFRFPGSPLRCSGLLWPLHLQSLPTANLASLPTLLLQHHPLSFLPPGSLPHCPDSASTLLSLTPCRLSHWPRSSLTLSHRLPSTLLRSLWLSSLRPSGLPNRSLHLSNSPRLSLHQPTPSTTLASR